MPPPPHVFPPLHAGPHAIVPPQPSATEPQFMPAGHWVSGVHGGVPHAFAWPAPPQTCPAAHVDPQSRIPPHPSAICPQAAFALWQVTGLQAAPPSPPLLPPHTLDAPPPPHVWGGVQGLQ
jgi:hypothetical protein